MKLSVAAASLWTSSVFASALLADVCFQYIHLGWAKPEDVLGVAAVVFGIVSMVFSHSLLAELFGID